MVPTSLFYMAINIKWPLKFLDFSHSDYGTCNKLHVFKKTCAKYFLVITAFDAVLILPYIYMTALLLKLDKEKFSWTDTSVLSFQVI